MSLKFGVNSSKSSSNSNNRPYFDSTTYSYYDGNTLKLDPTIRAAQDEATNRYAGIYGDIGNATNRFLTQSSDLRNKYAGNEGAMADARIRPIREKFAALKSQAQQDLGRRRVGGSSFGFNTLRSIDERGAVAEGDARALGTSEALQFEAGLNAQELEALNQQAINRAKITGESLEVARMRLMQELSVFGLGQSGTTSQTGRQTSFGGEAQVLPKSASLFG